MDDSSPTQKEIEQNQIEEETETDIIVSCVAETQPQQQETIIAPVNKSVSPLVRINTSWSALEKSIEL